MTQIDKKALEVCALALWQASALNNADARDLEAEFIGMRDRDREPYFEKAHSVTTAPSEGGDGWRDIASAPKDGTPIQIWQEGLEPNQYVAAFDEGWSNSGWWLICDGKNTEIPLRGPAPTYWRHVFDAPTPHQERK